MKCLGKKSYLFNTELWPVFVVGWKVHTFRDISHLCILKITIIMLIYCVQLIYHERFMNFIEMGIEMHFISSENCVCSFVNATAVVCVTESE